MCNRISWAISRSVSSANRLLIGLDYVNQKLKNDNSPYIVFDFVNALIPNDANYAKINRIAVDAKIAASTAKVVRNTNSANIYSAYASNVLNITDNLSAVLSLRVDRFEGREHTIMQPIPWWPIPAMDKLLSHPNSAWCTS